METLKIFAKSWEDYELIDAGGGRKLERWGNVITIRPELQAYFKSGKPFLEWYEMAHWEFITEKSGKTYWSRLKKTAPDKWQIKYRRLTVNIEIGSQKNIGVFPEQNINWEYIDENIKQGSKFLNLFAYTGIASLIARKNDCETFHVDSSKPIISKARENMESCNLLNIKWVLDDALKFVERENKRGNKYDFIILDPPAWGLGVKKEKWKLEDKLIEILNNVKHILNDKAQVILNTYSPSLDISQLSAIVGKVFKTEECVFHELWMNTTSEKELFFGNLVRITK